MKAACEDRQRWLARLADTSASDALTAADRAQIESHLQACESCRAALADQRYVAGVLSARPALEPSPAFAAALAARLDQASGWLGLLDWRLWTFRLAPIALAVLLFAVFSGSSPTSSAPVVTDSAVATLETWTRGVSESTSVASAVWQGRTSSDALLETMLLGTSTASGDANVR